MKTGLLYWITGLSGAGKTTIGNRLYYELKKKQDNVVLLDGDLLKTIVDSKSGYSNGERRARAMQYARLCKMLTDQGITVICCTISMYHEVREWNRTNNRGYIEVFLDVPIEVLEDRDQKGLYSKLKKGESCNLAGVDLEVEWPKNPDVIIKNDGSFSIESCVDLIIKHPVLFSSDYDRDSEYWNKFYESNPADINKPSLFAMEIGKNLKKHKNILDLGCGNGRDSIYFHQIGLNVTAIDASQSVIEKLQRETEGMDNIYFICDDFVCSSAIYSGQYDYCYSRFSMHAINEMQEDEMIENVYKVLKLGGEFFIEVRSIHDDLYGKGEKVGKNSYKYEGHYRRFVVLEELQEKLKRVGFTLKYADESTGFSPYRKMDPPIIRIICQKEAYM